METFDFKIKKIRSTIDDIRLDIESMKYKNEKTLSNIKNSITSLSNTPNTESNSNFDKTGRFTVRNTSPIDYRISDTYGNNTSGLSDVSKINKNRDEREYRIGSTPEKPYSNTINKYDKTDRSDQRDFSPPQIGKNNYQYPHTHAHVSPNNSNSYSDTSSKSFSQVMFNTKKENPNNYLRESNYGESEYSLSSKYDRVKPNIPRNNSPLPIGNSFNNYNSGAKPENLIQSSHEANFSRNRSEKVLLNNRDLYSSNKNENNENRKRIQSESSNISSGPLIGNKNYSKKGLTSIDENKHQHHNQPQPQYQHHNQPQPVHQLQHQPHNFNSNNNNNINNNKKNNIENNYGVNSNLNSNPNELYKTTQSTVNDNLEKQINELHVFINELQKKNAVLQMQVNGMNNKNDTTNMYDNSNYNELQANKNFDTNTNKFNNIETDLNDNYHSDRNFSRNTNNFNSGPSNGVKHNYNYTYNPPNSVPNYNKNINSLTQTPDDSEISSRALTKNAGGNMSKINYEEIVDEIISIMGVQIDPRNLPTKFKEYLQTFTSNKLRDEFIEKLTNIYINIFEIDKSQKVDIKIIWRWIKTLIKGNNHGTNLMDNNNVNDVYKEFCENIIKEYYLTGIEGLKSFINDLLIRNNKNNKRVEKIKKLLLIDPQSGSRENNSGNSGHSGHSGHSGK